MLPKYQVFVSSTFDDLRDEREAVTKAILEMGHIPVGMEMFSAADEQQWELIARQIASSDYYIVVVAHRYGSTVEGMSYTEKEYDYAIQQGVPVLGFLLEDSAPWPRDRTEPSKRLEAFKTKVKRKPVSFWKTAEELNARVLAALSKAFHISPRPGWVPANRSSDPRVTEEITRLSRENAELRDELAKLKASTSTDALVAGLAPLDTQFNLAGRGPRGPWHVAPTWADLFAKLAPLLMKTTNDTVVRSRVMELFAPGWDSLLYFELDEHCFETVRIQLMALGLVSVTELATTSNTRALFWALTQKGYRTMMELRVVRRITEKPGEEAS